GLYNGDLEHNWMQISRARATLGFSVAGGLQVYAGPSFNVLVADAQDADVDLAPWSVYDYTSDDVFVQLWPGFVAGVRVR
ncbi:MAG TPA: hypothetical protein VF190_12940, partial [Rhodothermales bacterium]